MRAILLERDADRPRLDDVPEPRRGDREVLVQTLKTGVDGTDEEVVHGIHGAFPEGRDRMVLGHECLGRVLAAPDDSGLVDGDLVVPLVRHGCGACDVCRRQAVDLCPSADYREHGIKSLDGFMRDTWVDEPEALVKVPGDVADVAILTEPLSVDVKALQVAAHVQRRIPWFENEGGFAGQRALLAGTGSLGSLAAMLLLEEGMEVTAVDTTPDDAPKTRWLTDLGVEHLNARENAIEDLDGFDLVIEATGSPQVVFDALETLAPNGVMVMLGVPGEKDPFPVEGDEVQRRMVLGNQVLVGSVNSNRMHFEEALRRLAAFKERWGDHVEALITNRYAVDEYEAAFEEGGDDVIKKVVEWESG